MSDHRSTSYWDDVTPCDQCGHPSNQHAHEEVRTDEYEEWYRSACEVEDCDCPKFVGGRYA